MDFIARCVILGMKKFKGEVEGKQYDNTKIYVEESFGKDNENARGRAGVEYNAGGSEIFDQLCKEPFPLTADLAMEISTTGKGTKTAVKKITLVKPAQGAQVAGKS